MSKFNMAFMMSRVYTDMKTVREYSNLKTNAAFTTTEEKDKKNEIYNLKGFKEDFKEHDKFKDMRLELRDRLLNTMLLKELELNPKLSLTDLADMESQKARDRKQIARQAVVAMFQRNNEEEIKKFYIDNSKVFRNKLKEYTEKIDFKDPMKAQEGVYAVQRMAVAHFEGSHELNKIGINEEELNADGVLHEAYGLIVQKNDEVVNMMNEDNSFANKNTEIYRSLAFQYLAKKAGIKHLTNVIADDKYTKNEDRAKVNTTAIDYAGPSFADVKTGIMAKLTDEEIYMLIFTPSLYNKLDVDFTKDYTKGLDSIIRFGDTVIYDSTDKTTYEATDKAVQDIKKLIHTEYEKHYERQMTSPIGADCFENVEVCDALVEDIQDVAAKYNASFQDKKFNKFGHSSSAYKEMQKDLEKFNKFMSSIKGASLANEISRVSVSSEVDKMINSINQYLDRRHPDREQTDFGNDYTNGRVANVKAALEDLTRLKKHLDSADLYYRRSEKINELFDDANKRAGDKIAALEKTIKTDPAPNPEKKVQRPTLTDEEKKELIKYANNAEASAYHMNAIVYSNNVLTDVEKSAIKSDFEKYCLAFVKTSLAKTSYESARMYLKDKNETDEDLLNRIRNTDFYKKHLGDTDKVGYEFVKNIFTQNYEKRVVENFNKDLRAEIDAKVAEQQANAQKNQPQVDQQPQVVDQQPQANQPEQNNEIVGEPQKEYPSSNGLNDTYQYKEEYYAAKETLSMARDEIAFQARSVEAGIDREMLANYIAIRLAIAGLKEYEKSKVTEDNLQEIKVLSAKDSYEDEASRIMKSEEFNTVVESYSNSKICVFSEDLDNLFAAYVYEYASRRNNDPEAQIGSVKVKDFDDDTAWYRMDIDM